MGSSLTLSCSAVFVLIGITLVAIAGFTDNWYEYTVFRRELQGHVKKDTNLNDIIYFSRNYGLFLVCFPDTVPSGIGSFSKLGQPCVLNPDLQPDPTSRDRFTAVQSQHLYFMRATVGCYLAGLVLAGFGLLVGAVGCLKKSARVTMFTGFVMFFAVIAFCAAIGLFHWVQYQERRMLNVTPYYRTWEPVLKQNTSFAYGWSYVLAWIGIVFLLLGAVCLFIAYRNIKNVKQSLYRAKTDALYAQHYEKSMMPYGGAYNSYDIYAGYYGHYPTMQAPNYYGAAPYMYGTH